MNGPRERLENRVRKALAAIETIGELSKYPDLLKPAERVKVSDTLHQAVNDAVSALEQNRESTAFRL